VNHLPYRPEHINDAIANAEELTNEELGAFTRLLWALWRAGGYLPDDSKKLARFSRAGSRWGVIAPAVMGKLTVLGGKVSCSNLLMTLMLVEQRRARAAKAAGVRHGKADGPLNSSKPLKSFNATPAQAAPENILVACNQNQNKNRESFNENGDKHDRAVKLLINKVGLRGLGAQSQLAKWSAALNGNDELLWFILDRVANENLTGSRLIVVMDQQVAVRQREAKYGSPLPFGPTIIRDANKG
jgi:uncharacterized protein YdaU (DUF1376 family)